MGLFDKVTQTASNVGKGVLSSAGKVSSTVATTASEQSELTQLKAQVNVINQELDSLYVQVGRRYVDYVLKNNEMPGIDATDLLKLMDPKLTKKKELEQKIVELEKEIKSKNIIREKQQVEEEFLAEKEKLDKALAMDILSQADYDAKLNVAKKKVDNFEEIRRIKQQEEMGLITKEERDEKIKALTE